MARTYRPDLDGIRTLAVYLVVGFHAGLGWLNGGFIGVDLFFVLSGFVVSNVILDELRSTGSLRLAHFYGRRVRRLLPAAVVAVTATSAVFLLLTSEVRRLSLVRDAQSALLYFSNWRFLATSNDYFAADTDKSPFLHFWSLSIEEQFYVGFPLLLLVVWRLSKGRLGTARVVTGVLLLGSVAAQLFWASHDLSHAYFGTETRFYQLMAGVLLALLIGLPPPSVRNPRWWPVSIVGLAGVLVLSTSLIDISVSWRGIAAAAASSALIAGTALGGSRVLALVLSWRPVVYLGQISYGTYLWHWPLVLVLRQVISAPAWVMVVLVGVGATGLAALSSALLEMPIRQSAFLARHRWQTVMGGLVASGLVAVFLVPPILGSSAKPLIRPVSSVAAEGSQGQRVPPMDWGRIAQDKGSSTNCPADKVARCRVHAGKGDTVLLVGDSMARSLTPTLEALAAEKDWTLYLNIVPACPWQSGVRVLDQPISNQNLCSERRGDWYTQALARINPDVVILMERGADTGPVWKSEVAEPRTDETYDELTLRTMQETVSTIEATGADVILFHSFLGAGDWDVLDCLSGANFTSECRVPVPMSWPASDAFIAALAAASDHVDSVNVNDILCPDPPLCEPIVGGRVVWRDYEHPNPTFLRAHRSAIFGLLKETGFVS